MATDAVTSTLARSTLYEVVDGREVEKGPMGVMQSLAAARLLARMVAVAEAADLGQVVVEMLFDLGPDVPRRRPDVAFVSYERWPRGHEVGDSEAWAVVPDLVVEVVGRSNSAYEVEGKLGEYFRAGVRRAWVLYPSHRVAYDFDGPLRVRKVDADGALDGGTLLPGLRMPLAELFEGFATDP